MNRTLDCRRSIFTLLFALFFSVSPLADAASTRLPSSPLGDAVGLGMLVTSFDAPPGWSEDEVRRCVVDALIARHWRIEEEADGHVVGYLNHRRYEARATFVIGASDVKVYCTGHYISRKGERAEPHIPVNWIKYVVQDTRIGFGVDPDHGGFAEDRKLQKLRTDLTIRLANSPTRPGER